MIVVDASALTDFLLGRAAAGEALAALLAGEPEEVLHAPDLVELETLNAVRGLVRGGELSQERAAAVVADLEDLRLIRYPHAPLRERVWALRGDLSAYDAAYLALAEALPEPVLVTADAGLAAVARRSLGRDGVRHVG